MPSLKVQTFVGVSFLVLGVFAAGVESLFCYRCLALDCPGGSDECESVRTFLTKNLREFYDVGIFFPACPALDDKAAWSIKQVDEDQCPETIMGAATCTLGRIQVSTRIDKNTMISHATVLGCGKSSLLNLIKEGRVKNQCNLQWRNGTLGDEMFHVMKVEHCSKIEDLCSDRDFCVEPEQSVVKNFRNDKKSIAHFEYGLTVGIIVFVVVFIGAVIGAQYCSFPLNRAVNMSVPEDPDADSDIVRPRTVRKYKLRDNSEFS